MDNKNHENEKLGTEINFFNLVNLFNQKAIDKKL